MADELNWLADLLGQRLYRDGVELLPTKKKWNFVGGLNAVYNTSTGMVDITLGGGGFDWQESVRVGTVAPFVATRADNVLTATGNGDINVLGGIDGIITLAVDDRVLIQDQAAGADNGIYVITDLGSAITPWVMTRDVLADETGEITPGLTVVVEEGTVNGMLKFQCSNTGVLTMNVTAITFVFAGTINLVTAVMPGTVNVLGAANTVLQTDGATPGAEWRAQLSLGVTTAAVGDIRLPDAGSLVGWGGAGDISMLNKDAGDNLVLGGTMLALRPINVIIEPSTATIIRVGANQELGVVAGAIEIGQTALVATAGTVRLPDVCSVQAWGTGPVDVPILAKDAADDLSIGLGIAAGANPPDIFVGANGSISLYINGNPRLIQSDTYLEMNQASLQFDRTVALPTIQQEDLTTAGATGQLLTLHPQDETGTGATVGGSALIRGGNATGAAAANTGGNLTLRPGADGGFAGGVMGTLALQDGAAAPMLTIIEGGIATALWGAGGYASFGAGAYARFSGAGAYVSFGAASATAGSIRGDDTFSILAWGTGPVDVPLLSKDAADLMSLGSGMVAGAVPASVLIGAGTMVANYINGNQVSKYTSTVFELVVPTQQFDVATAAPVITQQVNTGAGITCENMQVMAQGTSDAGGTSTAGHELLRGGRGTGHANNTDGNVAIGEVPANWQSGEEIVFISDAVMPPTAAAAAGAFLWSEGANLQAFGIGLGLVAGSGAGSCAATGGLRMQGDGAVQGQIVFRNEADGGDLAGVCSVNGGAGVDTIWVGGPYPTRPGNVVLDSTGISGLLVGGVFIMYAVSGQVNINKDASLNACNIRYSVGTIAPKIYQVTDATAGVTGDDLTVEAQGVSDAAGGATAGDLVLTGGKGTVHANNLDGNVAFHAAPGGAPPWNSMEMGIFVGDCVTAPAENPAAGGYMYSTGGAGTWRGSGGTTTTFGPSSPRCSVCGHDHWIHISVNDRFGSYVLECGMCGKVYKKGPASVLDQLEPHELAELVYDDDDPNDPRPAHKKHSIIDTVIGNCGRKD